MMAEDRRLLVVNADDLGLHEDINRGIREAHERGIVTSTSLVACGQAFDDALRVLRDCPGLGVGVHLTLIEEKPLCEPGRIASLVGQNGRFHTSYRRFSERIFFGKIEREELRLELDTQVRRVLDAGIQPSHLDSHQHVHVLSPVWHVVAELAHRYGIPFVRVPRFQQVWARAKDTREYISRIGLNILSTVRRRQVETFKTANATVGLHLSGRLKAPDLLEVLNTLRPGLCELVVHPGVNTPDLEGHYKWGFNWSDELSALTAGEVQDVVRCLGIRLVNYEACHMLKI